MDAGAVTTARTVMRPAHPVQRVTSTSKVRPVSEKLSGPTNGGLRACRSTSRASVTQPSRP